MDSMIPSTASPEILTRAIEDNAAGFYLYQTASPHIHLDDVDHMIRVMSEVPFPIGNAILQAQLAGSPDEIRQQVDDALNPFKAHNIPMVWIVDSTTTPPDLGSYLVEAGLFEAPPVPGMVAPIDALSASEPAEPGLSIEPVRDEAALAAWIDIFETVFGIPDWAADFWFQTLLSLGLEADRPLRHYMAVLNGQVVGTSSMLLWNGAAGIYNVATIHAVRRRGIATASTMLPLREAYGAGYRIAILQSSQMALSLFRKMGFQEYCQFGAYAWMGLPPENSK